MKKAADNICGFQRVDKPSHSLLGLRVGAHEFQHSLRSDARPS